MFEYLTHYYKRNSSPFRSLTALSESEAIKIMKEQCDDTPFFSRFKEPNQYRESRLQTEKWLRESFIEKGGKPKDSYPLYAVLGRSEWIENYSSLNNYSIEKLEIPISIFEKDDISFTVPDSMVSYWLNKDKPLEFYRQELHGNVFTLSEAIKLINVELVKKLEMILPEGVVPYVEVQIWNHEITRTYIENVR